MKKSPLARVRERFESKAKLVEAVQGLATAGLFLDRVNPLRGLARVSNEKLLRLHRVLTQVRDEFGGREQLIASIVKLEKRDADEGFKTRLARFSTPRLVDEHRAAARRAKGAAAPKTEAAPKKRLVRSKKAQAKASA